jgi:hypothetical protein
MDRRGFLRVGFGGSAAIALASLVPAGCEKAYPHAGDDRLDLQSLTPKEYAVVRAAAEALLVGVPVTPATVAQRIDRELAAVGDPIRKDMKTVLSLMEHATPLSFHVRRFTALTQDERLVYMRGWRDSRFQLRRAAYQALKGFIYYFAYIDPATRAITGFQGPWQERVTIPARAVDFGEVF